MNRTSLPVKNGQPVDLNRSVKRGIFHVLLPRYFENDFQRNRYPERQARNTAHQTARIPRFSKNVPQQLRSPVRSLRVVANVPASCN